MSSKRAINRVC